jgi:predicted 3-demethylubiquinone-9 3-methyltransferase (glyoxalase superfamily)
MTHIVNKIVPHLWFDTDAIEAVKFYTSLFSKSKIVTNSNIDGTPSGSMDILTFELLGQKFVAINAGPMFRFNNSVSLFVYCGSETEIERLYDKLSKGGFVLMPLGKYEWSVKYAWVKDKFGLSWQLDVDDINSSQKILPSLLFVNEKAGRVKEAAGYYMSIFPDSGMIMESPYGDSAGAEEGALLFAQFRLSKYLFNAMSSTLHHDFDFNESFSFMVNCDTQEEVDYFWDKLTSGGEEQQCGWVKDKFGLSWQIIPVQMGKLMSVADSDQLARVTAAMLKMKKLDIKTLKQAFDNH